MNLEQIKELSIKEKKTILERFLKLSEETGELAEEILIKNKSSGLQNKLSGTDGIKGECIDVIIVALSIFFMEDGQILELNELMKKKCSKWQSLQL